MDIEKGKVIAVKQIELLSNVSEDIIQGVINEIRMLTLLKHPHIVEFLGHERVQNSFNIFMEYVPGQSLESVLREFGPLSEDCIMEYTSMLTSALEYTSSLKVVHRDIKVELPSCRSFAYDVDTL